MPSNHTDWGMLRRLGQQHNVGEKPIVNAGTTKHNNNYKRYDKLGYSSICYIGSRIGWVSMKEVYKL